MRIDIIITVRNLVNTANISYVKYDDKYYYIELFDDSYIIVFNDNKIRTDKYDATFSLNETIKKYIKKFESFNSNTEIPIRLIEEKIRIERELKLAEFLS